MALRRRQTTRETPPPEGKGRVVRSLLLGLGSVVLTVVLVLALIAGTVLFVFGPSAPLVTVPNVVGMASAEGGDPAEGGGGGGAE